MHRHLFLTSGVAAVLAIGGIASVADAGGGGGDGHDGLLHATGTQVAIEAYDVDLSTGACTHQDPTTARCAIPFYGTNVVTGDLVGQEQNAGGLSVTPQLIGEATSLATFSWTVKGCPGPGTAMFRYETTMGVDGQTGHNHGSVEVVPGSGTGGLATLKGVGDVDVTPSSKGSLVGTDRLDFSCRGGHHN